jgi:hypothetical protein
MIPIYVPELDPDFKSPAVEASFRSLFSLAHALLPRILDLSREPGALRQVVFRLGLCALDQFGKSGPTKDLDRAWIQFFNYEDIGKLSQKVLKSLEAAHADSLRFAGEQDTVISDLTTAHQRGHLLVKSMLESNGLRSLFCEPASLVVSYDHTAMYYCAAASPLEHQIRWVHQPVPHSLHGALFPDLIIAHEYLSHLIPRNPRLDKSIPEVWLIVALIQWMEDHWEPSEDRAWRRQLWFHLREAIRAHLMKHASLKDTREDQARLEGVSGVYEFALLLYGKSQPSFWKLTGAMLSLGDTKGSEANLLRLLEKMMADGHGWREMLIDGKWQKIEDLF